MPHEPSEAMLYCYLTELVDSVCLNQLLLVPDAAACEDRTPESVVPCGAKAVVPSAKDEALPTSRSDVTADMSGTGTWDGSSLLIRCKFDDNSAPRTRLLLQKQS